MDFSMEGAIIEAVLLMEHEPLDSKQLSKITDLSQEVIEQSLEILCDKYKDDSFGIEIVQIGGGYSFAPKDQFWSVLKTRYGRKMDSKLSRAALETLSIIAYSQPITRPEIDNIRGVSSDSMVKLLLERHLIKEAGKKEAPGRPVLYTTSKEFLKLFKLNSISELPKLDELTREKFELNG